jgi:hypothetical protein
MTIGGILRALFKINGQVLINVEEPYIKHDEGVVIFPRNVRRIRKSSSQDVNLF